MEDKSNDLKTQKAMGRMGDKLNDLKAQKDVHKKAMLEDRLTDVDALYAGVDHCPGVYTFVPIEGSQCIGP